jgi:hypothetical protein
MENKQLVFDDGIVEFNVNGKAKIRINPTDAKFVRRLYGAFEEMDKRQEGYKARIEKMANNQEVFAIADDVDAEVRELIDGIFGDVSPDLFGDMSVCALAGGLPIWCNFMLAVMDEIDTAFTREQKATNPRVQKYTAKYHR